MKSLRQVWAAAQRNPCAKRPSARISAEPKATIEIPVHFDRVFTLIPTGCALRWAQKDEGAFRSPPTSLWTPIPPPKRWGGIRKGTAGKLRLLSTRATESQLCFCALKPGLYKAASALGAIIFRKRGFRALVNNLSQ